MIPCGAHQTCPVETTSLDFCELQGPLLPLSEEKDASTECVEQILFPRQDLQTVVWATSLKYCINIH